jgi:hypothetical protein
VRPELSVQKPSDNNVCWVFNKELQIVKGFEVRINSELAVKMFVAKRMRL